MSIINKMLVDCALKKHTIHEKVLRYTDESTENKVDRLIGTCNCLLNGLQYNV